MICGDVSLARHIPEARELAMSTCAVLLTALSLCNREYFVRQNDGGRRPVATASENTEVLG